MTNHKIAPFKHDHISTLQPPHNKCSLFVFKAARKKVFDPEWDMYMPISYQRFRKSEDDAVQQLSKLLTSISYQATLRALDHFDVGFDKSVFDTKSAMEVTI